MKKSLILLLMLFVYYGAFGQDYRSKNGKILANILELPRIQNEYFAYMNSDSSSLIFKPDSGFPHEFVSLDLEYSFEPDSIAKFSLIVNQKSFYQFKNLNVLSNLIELVNTLFRKNTEIINYSEFINTGIRTDDMNTKLEIISKINNKWIELYTLNKKIDTFLSANSSYEEFLELSSKYISISALIESTNENCFLLKENERVELSHENATKYLKKIQNELVPNSMKMKNLTNELTKRISEKIGFYYSILSIQTPHESLDILNLN